jgi:mono/diheme cytochrome c family protein
MGRAAAFLLLYVGLGLAQVPAPEKASADAIEFFETRIRPILIKNCFACHTTARSGGLQLDAREAILKGGNSGPAIIAGDPEHSLLIQAVSYTHQRLKMPPPGKLSESDIANLTAWVKAGAVWGGSTPPVALAAKSGDYVITPRQRAFWAFQPVRQPVVPEVRDSAWPKNAIDRFILTKLEQNGLRPVAPADKRILLRRATFDLIGLPPTPHEMDAFLSDQSPDAFAKVVDRLLASPRYGERWGRYWLDLARYADGKLGASKDTPYANAFRYRDWVINAFNEDMPYDRFVKAQIAADLMPESDREKLLPGLGFQALGDGPDDQVDVTTRTFLALTVGCARCHDHKYDPIPTRDYYSLLGIFSSSQNSEVALTTAADVEAYKKQQKKIDNLQEQIDDFIQKQSNDLSRILVRKTARYMEAAWKVLNRGVTCAASAEQDKLSPEILERWVRYLKDVNKDHQYLKPWFELQARGGAASEGDVRTEAELFQVLAISLFEQKKAIDDRNYVKLGGAQGAKDERTRQYTNLESLPIEKYYLWRDLASEPYMRNGLVFPGGIYYYGLTSTLKRDFEVRGGEMPEPKDIDGFLSGEWKEYLASTRAELAQLKRALPPQYPFLHAISDKSKPANARVAIRGNPEDLGEEAPRHFLQILCNGKPSLFTGGSGRLQLAGAIADPNNPLTARVMVNRVWHWHFGRGIVAGPGNFGLLGERPTNPELLDYLASHFIASGW